MIINGYTEYKDNIYYKFVPKKGVRLFSRDTWRVTDNPNEEGHMMNFNADNVRLDQALEQFKNRANGRK